MILHFVIDGKITDDIIDNFLAVSKNNHFLVFGVNKNQNFFKRIKQSGNHISIFDEKQDNINKIIKDLNVKAVVVHPLTENFAKVILQINHDVKICWRFWGHDIYSLPKIAPQTFAPKTNVFLLKTNPLLIIKRSFISVEWLRRYYFERIIRKKDPLSTVFDAMKRINFFASSVVENYNIFQKYYPNDIKYINCTFSTIDQYLAGDKNLRLFPNANNIIIGNSASASSNYLDAISLLKSQKVQLNKVFVVLSYGNNESYKKEVLLVGEKMLKPHFVPLLDFIEREKYIQILQTCSVGIFNHYRQQAMGNIFAMLYMGARVYLSTKNPAYHFFLRNGIEVNNIEREFSVYGIERLSNEIANKNRCALDAIYSKENVIKDLTNLTQILTS